MAAFKLIMTALERGLGFDAQLWTQVEKKSLHSAV